MKTKSPSLLSFIKLNENYYMTSTKLSMVFVNIYLLLSLRFPSLYQLAL